MVDTCKCTAGLPMRAWLRVAHVPGDALRGRRCLAALSVPRNSTLTVVPPYAKAASDQVVHGEVGGSLIRQGSAADVGAMPMV